MNNQAITIELFFEKTVGRTTTLKLLMLNTLGKIAVVLNNSLSQMIASIALVLFNISINIGLSRGFSGFCSDNKSNSCRNETC
ncbi:MAG: hypothetical protein H7Y10_01415 [Flavobacterium sp.]|nr:hypothetical protein [Flavobacterium sp.]